MNWDLANVPLGRLHSLDWADFPQIDHLEWLIWDESPEFNASFQQCKHFPPLFPSCAIASKHGDAPK